MDLKLWEEKIKEKRKNTPWRDFVKEICSRYGLVFRKNNGTITNYSDKTDFPLYSTMEYEKIRDGFIEKGREYDSSLSLFDQIASLRKEVGILSPHFTGTNENVLYSDGIWGGKNIYLSYQTGGDVSNILYSFYVKLNTHNVFDSMMVRDGCDIVYQSSGIIKSYKVFYSKYIVESNNIRFSTNLIGCSECLFCDNLTNQKYCIYNKVLSKEEYEKEKEKILSQKIFFLDRFKKMSHIGNNIHSDDCEGNFIVNSEGVKNGLRAYQVKNGNNIVCYGGSEPDANIFDCCVGGTPMSSDNYGCYGAGGGSNVYMCAYSYRSSNLYYCMFCENCSYCLGCVGLKNKSFCILNKQYTKEEWFEKANEILGNMDKDGSLGKFFPASMNAFYFNDTIGYLIDDSFTKEEVTKEGFLRRDEDIKVDMPENAEIITSKDFSQYQGFNTQGEWEISQDVLKKVIKDEQGDFYRIVPMELDFLQKHGLPLPEIHWLERIKLGFKFK